MKYTLRASGWTHSTKSYRDIKICIHRILEQLVGTMNYFVCISVSEIYLETFHVWVTKTLLRPVHGAMICPKRRSCAVLPLANKTFTLTISKYNKLSTVGFVSISCQGERIRNNCKAWYQKLLSANGHMFTPVRVMQSRDSWSGHKNDSRGNSRASAKQLPHNESCRFQLEYIDMEPNHTLSIANIVENRYTWTEPPDVERAFHSRQISETRLKSRRHESELWRWQ